jgi:6-phosphogluconolactonase
VPKFQQVQSCLLKSAKKRIFTSQKISMNRCLASFILIFLTPFAIGQDHYLLVGTYDSPKSEGIYVYKFNSNDGSVKKVSHTKTPNPSFLAVSPDQKFVYAVNETADSTGKGGGITSFSFNKNDGLLNQLNRQSSEGNHPCYITTDKTGKWAIVSNYSTGTLALLSINGNGELEKSKAITQYYGSGPDTFRQRSSHIHTAVLDSANNTLYVTDLGNDELYVHGFDSRFGIQGPKQLGIKTSPGSGPRHLVIHPNGKFLYLLEELSGGVSVFSINTDGRLFYIHHVSILPKDYSGPAGSADIHVSPDGKFLYASNRGNSNTIAIFRVDNKSGKLSLIGHQSTLGKTPRNFNFDPTGKFLLVGNQGSDEIVIFKRDLNTGLLTDTGKKISVGKPVCLKWISIK